MGQNALAKIADQGLRSQVSRLLQIFETLSSQGKATRAFEYDVVLYSSERYWDRAVRKMLRELAHVETRLQRRLLVCRIDLCDDETLRSAKLLVLPTPGADSLLHSLKALQRGIPLLAKDTAGEPKDLCEHSKAGLVYSSGEELGECLELLLTNEPLRQALGRKGGDFIREQMAHASPLARARA
jgi:glycosyltransferase involved in cell wall biosynthesis